MKAWSAEIQLPAWTAIVQAWYALERATGFQVVGKALPTHGRPKAVQWWVQRARKNCQIPPGLDDEDGRENFYLDVMKWWVGVNPGWRKDGLAGAEDFGTHGLKQENGGGLEDLYAGLNGMTSVVACLWWWYRIANIAEGAPVWIRMVQDVTWVLNKKIRDCGAKRSAPPSADEPVAKRARTV
ncbi:hypothetical protein K438DRAFT_1638241 [Mycena galopus ATCC 62051]|nr:hypothetical protein K438DRAFT_1638241 [Mycena galopus ATCC 62051]